MRRSPGTVVYTSTPTTTGVYEAGGPHGVLQKQHGHVESRTTIAFRGDSPVTIAGVSEFSVTNLSVTLNITYPKDSDLSGFLIAPDGSQILLFAGVSGVNFTGTVLNDQAALQRSVRQAQVHLPARSGRRILSPISPDRPPMENGPLKVVDRVKNSTGKLNSWPLSVTTGTADVYVTTTDASGHYSFSGLPLGVSYNVREVTPTGYIETIPMAGSAFVDAHAAVGATTANFSNFPTSFVAAGANDSYYLAVDPTDTYLEISAGTSGLSPATYRVALANLPALTFTLQGANSELVVDFTNGSPIPAGNLTLNMTANSNQQLQIIGQTPGQTFSLNDTQFSLDGGGAIAYQNLPNLTLMTCTVNGSGALDGVGNINVGNGATLNF